MVGNLTGESFLIAGSGVVIVFIMLAVLSGMIVVMSKVVGAVSGAVSHPISAAPTQPLAAKHTPVPTASPAPVVMATPSTAQSAPYGGVVALSGVDDLTAACIMAIVSDETGVPLTQLTFKSIKAI